MISTKDIPSIAGCELEPGSKVVYDCPLTNYPGLTGRILGFVEREDRDGHRLHGADERVKIQNDTGAIDTVLPHHVRPWSEHELERARVRGVRVRIARAIGDAQRARDAIKREELENALLNLTQCIQGLAFVNGYLDDGKE